MESPSYVWCVNRYDRHYIQWKDRSQRLAHASFRNMALEEEGIESWQWEIRPKPGVRVRRTSGVALSADEAQQTVDSLLTTLMKEQMQPEEHSTSLF